MQGHLANPELLPEEQRVFLSHREPQILTLVPKRQAPKTSGVENQQGPDP